MFVSLLVRKMGYSPQKPVEQATQRDEQAIERWKGQHWPQVKKAEQEKRMLLFVDEAGFYLLPMVVRTYAPCGSVRTQDTIGNVHRKWGMPLAKRAKRGENTSI